MAEIKVSFGGRSLEILTRALRKAGGIQQADILYALSRQKTRILERTARGVDIEEKAFEPYSSDGPYYHYPRGTRAAKSKARSAAAGRFAKKTGGKRTSLGVRYDSYGAFKRALGRKVVDLLGASAPHMLQAIVVKSGSNPQTDGVIGIYGPEADRAEGHNVGAGNLPRREFFGFSPKDERIMGEDIQSLIKGRIDKALQ